MNFLPDEILHEIFLYVPECLFCFSRVDKRFHRISKSKVIRQLLFHRLPLDIQEMPNKFPETMSSLESLYRYKKNGQIQFHLFNLDKTVLALNGCQLESLFPEIGKFKNLQYLNLQCNKLKTLPKEIGQLKQFKYLWLSGNPIEFLPAEVLHLPYLDESCIFSYKIK